MRLTKEDELQGYGKITLSLKLKKGEFLTPNECQELLTFFHPGAEIKGFELKGRTLTGIIKPKQKE